MTRMMEREEAVKMVNDLNENVDGKVDRLELQPFKDYVGECPGKYYREAQVSHHFESTSKRVMSKIPFAAKCLINDSYIHYFGYLGALA